MEAGGHFLSRRRQQALTWMHELVGTGLDAAFRSHPGVAGAIAPLEAAVAEGRTTPVAAARELLTLFGR
jgi:LAO/AO transport system kinase